MRLGPRFHDALEYALQLHQNQQRKVSGIPYFAHLMSACAITLEYGGDEDAAIAALLHDGPEDQGGVETLNDIRERFGDAVADAVASCSDTFETPKPAWRPRKEAYIKHLAEAGERARLVSAADKLHNARSMLQDYRQVGEQLWARFNAGRDEVLWYHHALVAAFRSAGGGAVVDELDRVISEIETLVADNRTQKNVE